MKARNLKEEDQTLPGFDLNTFRIFSNPRGRRNEEATSKVRKEDIVTLNEFRASSRETLLRRESSTLVGSSKLCNA